MAKQFDPLVSCRYGKAVINKYLFDSKFEPECRTYQVTKNSVFVIQKEYFEFPYLDSDYYYTADMFIRDIKKKKHNNPICLGMYRNGLEMAKAFECAKQNMDKIRFFNTHNGVIVTGEYIYIEFFDYYSGDLVPKYIRPQKSQGIVAYCISPNEE